MIYKTSSILFIIFQKILFALSLLLLLITSSLSNTLESKNKDFNDKNNEELIKGVLMGAGFNFDDALNAIKSFKKAYPPERLTASSYIILPFIDKKMSTFAISIDGIEAVLVTKINNIFKTFITSSKYAHKFVEKGLQEVIGNKNLLEIETSINKQIELNSKFIEDDIVFEKGDSLIKFLYAPGALRKDIRNAIKVFSIYMKPQNIKEKTKGKIIRTNKSKILGFYLIISSKKAIVIYLSPAGFEAIKISSNLANETLYKKIKSYRSNYREINNTRISLLNDPQLKKRKIKINKGSNLFDTLKNEKVFKSDIVGLLDSLKNIYNPKIIRPNQEITLVYKDKDFFGLSIIVNDLRSVQVIKTDSGFKEYILERPFKKVFLFKEIEIKSNLYVDSLKAGLPQEVLIDMVRLFSYSIDFQRDIRKSNSFFVYYEFLNNYKDEMIMPGNIIYALAKLKNTRIDMFRYENANNKHKYFSSDGKSIRKTLMKTPIDGARLSSGFGRRIHPILGYSKMHKGVDFAAKTGTPIYAAGDGVIERANNYGGYGKYIRIRHNSEYKTAYAHLNKFARKIRKGVNVKQGQVIGYVGSTGRSTGPHLHYEILLNDKQINPQRLSLPEEKKLNEEELIAFRKIKQTILKQIEGYIN